MAALLAASLAPVAALALWLYYQDHRAPEPPAVLARAFAWGMLSVLPALAIESQLMALVPRISTTRVMADALIAFGVAGLVQEGVKLWAVRRALHADPNVDEPVDWAVYGGFVALGFAAVENVAYVVRGGFEAAAVRALVSVPAHALLGVLMGWFLATGPGATRRAWLVPAFFHGAFNFIALRGGAVGGSAGALWALVAFLWIAGFSAFQRLRERRRLPHR